MSNSPEMVPVNRIFLSLDNPRHEAFDTEAKAIEYLCEKENIYPLARDIATHHLNPLERFALIPVAGSKGAQNGSYYVAEGNRRLCAIKLLNDPDLAPAKFRQAFEKLSEKWTPIATVPVVVFENYELVRLWLDRIHSGAQGGIGRKEWNAEQKTRFSGGNKNRTAQALLDYAEAEKMISPDERNGKLTTFQRFLGNDVFREVLGLDQSIPGEVGRNRPKGEFDVLLKRFIRDLVKKEKVNSRMNKDQIIRYVRPLGSLPGVTSTRIETESLTNAPLNKPGQKPRHKKPRKPEKAKHVQYEEEISLALRELGNGKLESLYHSIITIDLADHCPLVSVGCWSFFETLTACAGRNDAASFFDFLSNQKLQSYGVSSKTSDLRNAIKRISDYGNSTKHHPQSAAFNGDQLNNDVITLKEVILKILKEVLNKGS